tara:strand:+ start:457 stop:1569 length:1113 start_codon:yes stop_codon:yes gene_type:complete
MHIINFVIKILVVSGIIFSEDCRYLIEKKYFNEELLSFYLGTFDPNSFQSQYNLFSYEIIPEGNNCSASINIEYTLKLFAPIIGVRQYLTVYKAELHKDINIIPQVFDNTDFIPFITLENSNEFNQLISFISYSGKLPEGLYHFQLSSNNSDVILPEPEILDVNYPNSLELISPGGSIYELAQSYTYNRQPIFTWYSDFCNHCSIGIRICEFNKTIHNSIEDALSDWSLIPRDNKQQFYILPNNTSSFKYPSIDQYMDLEVGKYYVWQIQRSYETTMGEYYEYSPVNIFELRSSSDDIMNIEDPYLKQLNLLLGEEKYNLFFGPGGELEGFLTQGESIKINNEEVSIDILYALVSDLIRNKIKIESIEIK